MTIPVLFQFASCLVCEKKTHLYVDNVFVARGSLGAAGGGRDHIKSDVAKNHRTRRSSVFAVRRLQVSAGRFSLLAFASAGENRQSSTCVRFVGVFVAVEVFFLGDAFAADCLTKRARHSLYVQENSSGWGRSKRRIGRKECVVMVSFAEGGG